MKIKLLIIFVILFFTAKVQAEKIILDTDMESDVDDVGALAMLHSFANMGEAEILGTISCSLNPWSAPTIDVINTYFGRPNIPIGNVQTMGVYRSSEYAKELSELYPHDVGLGESTPNSITVYREILSKQPDKSVVIVTLGYLTNLAKLMKTGADKYSPLSGLDLIKQKVKHLVCMGGKYPLEQDPGKFGNFKPDPLSIRSVAEEWPTKIFFTGGGKFANDIPVGKIFFTNRYENGNPITKAYKLFLEKKKLNQNYHHAADLIAVYVAVRGYEPFFKLKKSGYYHIFEDGTCVWRLNPDNPNHYIVAEFADGIDPLDVGEAFDSIMGNK